DELNLAFNFLMVHEELAAAPMLAIVEGVEEKFPDAACPVYTGSNHDASRLATPCAHGHTERARAALLLLLTLLAPPLLDYRRGERHAVALNLSHAPAEVGGLAGVLLIATDRARDGEQVSGALALGPWEGAVLELADRPLGFDPETGDP